MNRLGAENQRLQEQLTRKAAALDRALDRMGDLALPGGAGAQHWFKIDASTMDRTARVAVFCGGGFVAKKALHQIASPEKFRTEKEKGLRFRVSPYSDWRPHGGSNPGYRRERAMS